MESNLYEDLDLDSIDAIDIVVKIKKELKIELMPEQFKQVRTVEDVVNVIFDIVKDR
jgi:acyl carrier protein